MNRLFTGLAALALLVVGTLAVKAQSPTSQVVLSNSYYQVCVNTQCQFHFNTVFDGKAHLSTVYVDYAAETVKVQLWDRVIFLEAGEALSAFSATPDPNNSNRTIYHLEFTGADETFTNQYGTLIGPTVEDTAFGSVDFALVSQNCGGGKGGSKTCLRPDSTTTATVNY
jgi:hypothetical protein